MLTIIQKIRYKLEARKGRKNLIGSKVVFKDGTCRTIKKVNKNTITFKGGTKNACSLLDLLS